MEKNKDKKKTTKVVKEQDEIKKSDYENESDTKKIIIVALILALLIGGFAYVRSLEHKKKDDGKKTEEQVDKEDEEPTIEENNNPSNSYQPTTTPSNNKVVDIWEELKNIPSTVEAGDDITLPEIKVNDNGEQISALISYQYRANIDEEYDTVNEFDTTRIGEYLITYTLSYKDGKIETKEVIVIVNDTIEPIINNVSDGVYYNQDILLDITEYSPYIVELNGVEYDETLPINVDGEYTLTVTEDTEDGRSITVTFILDKTLPTIDGVEDNGIYNSAKIINVTDTNLDTILVTKDEEEVSFANGVTSIAEDGEYQITATDKAGNTVTYSFIIDTALPLLDVTYTPDNSELTNESVVVTITANEELQALAGWTLAEDKLSLTKEYTENTIETIVVKDLAGNIVNIDVVVDYIDYNVSFNPKLTLENLVANKVKATITSLKQLILDGTWTESIENGLYKYEKIYSESGLEIVNYEDSEGNTGSIEVNINITLNNLFVTYDQDAITQNVKAFVTTEEEVIDIPVGWTKDDEYLGTGYRYYKEYTENVDYEVVEFVTDVKTYVATIIIDSIDREDPVAEADITYIKESDEKKSVVITVTANEEITAVEGWSLSEDKQSILKIVTKPAVVPTEEQEDSVTVTDLKGNDTVVEYSYNWN